MGDAAAFLIAAAFAAQAGASAATGAIRGFVTDPQGAGISGARVEIVCGENRRQLTTDAGGAFSASRLPATRCTMTAEADLFDLERATFDLTGASTAAITLTLRVRGLTAEVVVTPTRGFEEETFDAPEALSVVSRSAIDSAPHQLLPQVLREQPGILLQQTTTAHTSPVIRGFTGPGNIYLVDGVRFNNGAWRSGPSQLVGGSAGEKPRGSNPSRRSTTAKGPFRQRGQTRNEHPVSAS